MGTKRKPKIKKDFSTKRQIKKIVSNVPDIKHQAKEVTELEGGI